MQRHAEIHRFALFAVRGSGSDLAGAGRPRAIIKQARSSATSSAICARKGSDIGSPAAASGLSRLLVAVPFALGATVAGAALEDAGCPSAAF